MQRCWWDTDIRWLRLPCATADRTRHGAAACKEFQLSTPPVADMTGEKKYTEIQTMLDFTAPAGQHYYFKCPFLRELTDEAIRTIVDYAESMPTEHTRSLLEHMHGAASRVPVTRDGFWPSARPLQHQYHASVGGSMRLAEKCIDWARGLLRCWTHFGASDGYVNYLGEEGPSAVKASYGANYARLASLKKKYDPENFFRFNQNIAPEELSAIDGLKADRGEKLLVARIAAIRSKFLADWNDINRHGFLIDCPLDRT